MPTKYLAMSENLAPYQPDKMELIGSTTINVIPGRMPSLGLGFLITFGILLIGLGLGQIGTSLGEIFAFEEPLNNMAWITILLCPLLVVMGACTVATALFTRPHTIAACAVFHWYSVFMLAFIVAVGAVKSMLITYIIASVCAVIQILSSIIMTVYAKCGW